MLEITGLTSHVLIKLFVISDLRCSLNVLL